MDEGGFAGARRAAFPGTLPRPPLIAALTYPPHIQYIKSRKQGAGRLVTAVTPRAHLRAVPAASGAGGCGAPAWARRVPAPKGRTTAGSPGRPGGTSRLRALRALAAAVT